MQRKGLRIYTLINLYSDYIYILTLSLSLSKCMYIYIVCSIYICTHTQYLIYFLAIHKLTNRSRCHKTKLFYDDSFKVSRLPLVWWGRLVGTPKLGKVDTKMK